jgi:hypothetical protein
MKDTFRYFIKTNFVEAMEQMTIQAIDELGEEFHRYLDIKLKDETKEKILPKNAMDVIMNIDHPLKQNGFHPAYVMHFHEWIKVMQEQQE